MSRHTKFFDGKELCWGYDRPLKEYFFQLYLNPEGKNGRDTETVFAISNRCTLKRHPDFPDKKQFTNQELVDIMKKYPVPKTHLNKIKKGIFI